VLGVLRLGVKRPILALAFVLATSLAAVGVLVSTPPRLDVRLEALFPQSDSRLAELEAFRATYGRGDRSAVVLLELAEGSHALDPAAIAHVASLSAALQELPFAHAEGVVSLSHVTYVRSQDDELRLEPLYTPGQAWVREEVAHLPSHPIYQNRVVSPAGRHVGFVVPLDPLEDTPSTRAAFAEGLLALSPGPGERLWVDGAIVARARIRALVRQDMRRVWPAAALVLLVILVLWLRDLAACALALAVVGLAALWTFAAMSLLGIPLNPLSTAIPVLLLVAGVGDALHLLGRLRQRLAQGAESLAALEAAVDEVGLACFFTSVTTAVGFSALALSDVPMLSQLGVPVALGVLFAFVLTILLLPPCLRGPRWVAWAVARGGERGFGERVAGGLWRLVSTRRRIVLAGALVIALGSLALLPWLRVETRMLGDFGPESPLSKTRAAFETLFGGVSTLEVIVRAPPGAESASPSPSTSPPTQHASEPWFEDDFGEEPLEGPPARLLELDVQRALAAATARLRSPELRQRGVLTVHSLPDYLADMNHVLHERAPGTDVLPETRQAVAQFLLFYEGSSPRDPTADLLAGDRLSLRVQVRIENLPTHAFFELVEAVRAEVSRDLPAGFEVVVTGNTLMIQAAHQSLVRNLIRGLSLALLAVFLAVLAVSRSWRLALVSLLPNLLPLLIGLALLSVGGVALRLATSAIFCVVFGIAVDDTIHFLAALRARRDLAPRDRLQGALVETGSAIVGTTAVLAGGFSVLLLSGVQANRLFGLLCAVTLVGALLCDLLLLPALLLPREEDA
jgi:predicted RND superfamily exporter protein